MFKMIFEREILNQIRLQKFLVSVIVTLVLTVLCLGISSERYLYKVGEYTRAVQHQRDMLARTRNMTEMALGTGVFETADQVVFRKPNSLFIFCNGKDDHLGDIAKFSSKSVPLYAEPYSALNRVTHFDLRNTLSDFVGKLDFGDIIKFLFSLIAVFIGFDIISSEREQGTLKLIYANSISRLTIIFAKWCAGLVIIAVALIIALLISFLYLNFAKDISFQVSQGVRIIMLFALALFYVLVFYQLSFLASGKVSSSKTAMVSLVVFWAAVAFMLPNAGTMFGRYFSPMPPIDYMHTEEGTIKKKYDDAIIKLMNSGDREGILAVQEKSRDETWQMQKYYIDSLYKQYRTALAWSLASPAAVFDAGAEIVMGTSTADYTRFMDRVRLTNEAYTNLIRNWKPRERSFDYRKQFNTDLNELIVNASYDDNRLTFRESIEEAASYFILLIILNALLMGIILKMNIRVHIT